MNELTNGDNYDFIYSMEFRAIVGAPIAIIILLPLSLIRDMSGFRYVSFASIIALFYTGIVLIAELPGYIHNMQSDTSGQDYTIVPWCFDWNLFTGASLTFFAYTCQV